MVKERREVKVEWDFRIADKKKAKSEDLAFKFGSSYWT